MNYHLILSWSVQGGGRAERLICATKGCQRFVSWEENAGGGLGGILLKTGTLSAPPEGERKSQMAAIPDKPGRFTSPVVPWGQDATRRSFF